MSAKAPDPSPKTRPDKKDGGKSDRNNTLAQTLRENLKRRKQQARLRNSPENKEKP